MTASNCSDLSEMAANELVRKHGASGERLAAV